MAQIPVKQLNPNFREPLLGLYKIEVGHRCHAPYDVEVGTPGCQNHRMQAVDGRDGEAAIQIKIFATDDLAGVVHRIQDALASAGFISD